LLLAYVSMSVFLSVQSEPVYQKVMSLVQQ